MESSYYTTQELAERLNLGVGWVERWRPMIVGAQRVGRLWRFDKAIIDKRVSLGQDVRDFKNLRTPGGRKYIERVHGAARNHLKGEKRNGNIKKG
jgi:hypothetical protein